MPEVLNNLGTYSGQSLYVYAPDYVNLKTVINLLKEPVIEIHYRLFLLNADETINRLIPEEDIIISEGNYSENYQNGQRKNLSIALMNEDGKYTPSGNGLWITDRFRFDVGISSQYYNYDTIYWFPKGIYVLGNPSAEHETSSKKINLTLLDKFAYLEGPIGTFETTYEIPSGAPIKDAIISLLNLSNGSGIPIDYKPIIYDKKFEGRTMPYKLSKDAGSTIGELILDLGTILNAEVFYDNMGYLTFYPINDTMVDIDKPTLWDYDDNSVDLSSLSLTYDFENTVNSIHVVGDEINNAIFYAFAENQNPLSPICIAKIGRRVLYINDSNIFSNSLAKDRARYELRKHGILSTTSTINVSFNPLLIVNNLISITDSFFKYNRERFLVQSITYNLGTGAQMTLSCSNLMNFEPDA